MDRNFDDLAERFQRRVYGGLKGRIRLAVLSRDIDQLIAGRKNLKVLDMGAGLGQLAIKLAGQGHQVYYNDLSTSMMSLARIAASEKNVSDEIRWYQGPYQELTESGFDLVLCHALLEWVDEPEAVVDFCASRLAPEGALSLTFYNPAAKVYRNLIRGNFAWLDGQNEYRSDSGSLTPNNPCSADDVQKWLKNNKLSLLRVSGIRVFHDYVVEKRGGCALPDAVVAKELQFSTLEPYKWLGRYLHYSCAGSGYD